MIYGVFEEDQAHLIMHECVIVVQNLVLEDLLQPPWLLNLFIKFLFRIAFQNHREGDPYLALLRIGLKQLLLRPVLLELGSDELQAQVHEELPVLAVDEPIMKHSLALMEPQLDEGLRILDRLRLGHQDALEHF